MTTQPLYVVPLLVEQPTWGGQYIAGYKRVNDPAIARKNIGQSFELASETVVTTDKLDEKKSQLPFLLAAATDLSHPSSHGQSVQTTPLSQLIAQDPALILGKKGLKKNGPSIKTLIKFTQARNNSYQVHLKPGQKLKHWLPKPESWYYFEPGKATLGLAPDCDVAAYKKRAEKIYQQSQDLSQQIQAKLLTVAQAKQRLVEFINQDHPQRFVQTIMINRDDILDLSSGGIHHSWETDPAMPNGNVVYEVQDDVKDEFCTLRSFDQGNIKNDGQVRPLSIDDYFTALNTNRADNVPQKYMRSGQPKFEQGATITKLFDNDYYHLTKLQFTGTYDGAETKLSHEFHHLFVKAGQLEVGCDDQSWFVPTGWSIFIPAGCSSYRLRSKQPVEVLKTTA